MEQDAALAEVARRKVKRAGGLLREVAAELAALTDDADVFGVATAHDRQSLEAARDLVAAGVARYGAVDVIVVSRPGRSGRV